MQTLQAKDFISVTTGGLPQPSTGRCDEKLSLERNYTHDWQFTGILFFPYCLFIRIAESYAPYLENDNIIIKQFQFPVVSTMKANRNYKILSFILNLIVDLSYMSYVCVLWWSSSNTWSAVTPTFVHDVHGRALHPYMCGGDTLG